MNYKEGDLVTVTFPSGREYEGKVLSDQGREVFVKFAEGAIHRAPKDMVAPSLSDVFTNTLKEIQW